VVIPREPGNPDGFCVLTIQPLPGGEIVFEDTEPVPCDVPDWVFLIKIQLPENMVKSNKENS
jgi:hypothetical protein